ncbi:hypothetical protein RFI_35920 [Reticulomyxa filosa]|uniref:UBC core domain-containing protein n=1 Tax=Reticulomyxa filosa TaxID=46433 RepID=X6LLB6_RETFI|nr:hypothetical protein RFI_35920 [Reticulomyxa filosa]|eukprot:ETO01520.1 hypothetical protein RFI_35920 [Reticulomyxa filosa]
MSSNVFVVFGLSIRSDRRYNCIDTIKAYPGCRSNENGKFVISFCIEDDYYYDLEITLPQSFPDTPPQLTLKPPVEGIHWINKKTGSITYEKVNKNWKPNTDLLAIISEIQEKVKEVVKKNLLTNKVSYFFKKSTPQIFYSNLELYIFLFFCK